MFNRKFKELQGKLNSLTADYNWQKSKLNRIQEDYFRLEIKYERLMNYLEIEEVNQETTIIVEKSE